MPPLATAMLTLGDRWVLLILQQAFLNHARRFGQWRDTLGISESVLTDRLRELTAAGILTTAQYREGHRGHDEYLLTPRGIDLWSLLVCMWTWEGQWVTPRADDLWLEHLRCHGSVTPMLGCGECGAFPVSARDTETVDRSRGAILGGTRRRHHRRTSRPLDPRQALVYDAQTLAILGDRWSTLVLGAAFTGASTFATFRDRLGIAPSVLSERLRTFVSHGILDLGRKLDRRSRSYRLTAKGQAFFPVLAVMWDWAEAHTATPDGPRDLLITHRAGAHRLRPRLVCNACHEPLERPELRFHDRHDRRRPTDALPEGGLALGDPG